jgi:diguanylate cyclase (GGDEF)-like protein/PAS domain S-box-containing protein
MGNEFDRELSIKYCHKFGKIAVDMGFVTAEQVKEALAEQIDDDMNDKVHRLIGEIMFMKGWITFEQIDLVLLELSKEKAKVGGQQVSLSEEYYRKVLDNLYDGMYFLDKDKKIIYWNKGAEKHTGYKDSEVIGRHCWDNILMHVDENGVKLCNGSCPITQTIADGSLREVEVYLQHKEGHRVPVSMRIAPIQDSTDQVVVAVEIFNEKSPKFTLHQKLEELKHLALIDPLTESGNRRYIEMSLKSRLEELDRYGWSVGVLFFDIDHFKNVNDGHGHNIGDRVLKMVSKTVSNSLRSFDVLGRWGGEEFIAILVNVNEEQLHSVSERLRLLVEQSSISIGSDMVRVTISIGATIAQKNDTINSVIKRADKLMYKSKNSGRNCISVGTNPSS